jgi:hypothetical protein
VTSHVKKLLLKLLIAVLVLIGGATVLDLINTKTDQELMPYKNAVKQAEQQKLLQQSSPSNK